jgi:glycerophosphoryl diester phosphodiesterase
MSLSQPRILAHRGAPDGQPENSLAAFGAAIQRGAHGVELDVHPTRDGALIVHHDAEIPGLGPIAELDRETVRSARLTNGEPIPLLGEALARLVGAEVWIELKSLPATADAALFEAIDQSPEPSRCAVHSFDHRIVARLSSRRPGLRSGILSTSYPIDPIAPLRAAGANTLWQEWHLIDPELVAAVHRAGAELIAWTVNDAGTARRLAEQGVDGLCGNFPERLRVG